MAEVPIETTIEEGVESVLEAVQAISTIQDNIHNKALENIKYAPAMTCL